MASRTPPFYLDKSISEAKFRASRKQELRKIWLRWKPRAEALKLARRKVQIGLYKNGNPKHGYEHKCNRCHVFFPQEAGKPVVEVNHKVSIGGWSKDIKQWARDLGEMWGRTLVAVEDLEVLCKPCHLKYTNAERSKK